MAVFGKVSGRLAPRDAIDNEFFRWLTKPISPGTACWSTMVLNRRGRPIRGAPLRTNRARRSAFPISHKRCFACTPRTGDLLRHGAGCPGKLESVSRALQHISLALPRFTKLSNRRACEFDVSLGPDGGRKISSKISPRDESRAWMRTDARIGDLAWPGGESTRARAMSWHGQHRKTRKLDTTDWPLVAAELERQPATNSV